MNVSRRKTLFGIGILTAGLGTAAVSGAFAAPTLPSPGAAASTATPAPTTTTSRTATSSTSTGTSPRAGGPGKGFGPRGMMGGEFGEFNEVATYLGISQSDLTTALKNGQTLAQIAQAHGKSAADLKAYLLNLDSQRIDTFINTNFQQLEAQHPRGPGGQLSQVATYLGISQSDLTTALKNGQTLAQIAQAHGKSAADLKSYLLSQLKSRLDQSVAAGHLTAQQETDRLNQAGTRIDQLINAKNPWMGGFGHRRGDAEGAETSNATSSAR